MRGAFVLGALMAVGLGGCVNTTVGETPEWADASGYPSLREVPTGGSSATTDPAHWSSIEADLLAARAAVQSHPRAQDTATVENPDEFLDQARREIEETRNSHNPY